MVGTGRLQQKYLSELIGGGGDLVLGGTEFTLVRVGHLGPMHDLFTRGFPHGLGHRADLRDSIT